MNKKLFVLSFAVSLLTSKVSAYSLSDILSLFRAPAPKELTLSEKIKNVLPSIDKDSAKAFFTNNKGKLALVALAGFAYYKRADIRRGISRWQSKPSNKNNSSAASAGRVKDQVNRINAIEQ